MRKDRVQVAKRETSYEKWIREEGIPIIEGYGIEDVTLLPRKPWARTGGKGAYIQLRGMEGFTGMYVGEISPGGAMNVEKHLCTKTKTHKSAKTLKPPFGKSVCRWRCRSSIT